MWKGADVPLPANFKPGVLPGVRTVATPVLSPQKIIDRLYTNVHQDANDNYGAFYSSILGGIVTNPAFMLMHVDDHMIHRGHAVSEIVRITGGYVYQLQQHIDRLKVSAADAGLELPVSEEALKRIVLDTAAASKKLDGLVRFWVTPGRGGFGLSDQECLEPVLYAMASSERFTLDRTEGWKGCASPIPPPHPSVATIRSNNNLPHVLAKMEAEQRGFNTGLFLNEEGHVVGAPDGTVGVLTMDNVLLTPSHDACVKGVTMQRIFELIPEEKKHSPNDVLVTDIQVRPITLEEVLAAKELFVVSTSSGVVPVVSLDEVNIADGLVGITALAFQAMLEKDMATVSEQHTAVPYGYTTGMRSQLV